MPEHQPLDEEIPFRISISCWFHVGLVFRKYQVKLTLIAKGLLNICSCSPRFCYIRWMKLTRYSNHHVSKQLTREKGDVSIHSKGDGPLNLPNPLLGCLAGTGCKWIISPLYM